MSASAVGKGLFFCCPIPLILGFYSCSVQSQSCRSKFLHHSINQFSNFSVNFSSSHLCTFSKAIEVNFMSRVEVYRKEARKIYC